MGLCSLLVLYGVVGIACTLAIFLKSRDRSAKDLAAAAIALPLWPLWAPIMLTSRAEAPKRAANEGAVTGAPTLEGTLEEAIVACSGTAMEPLLTRQAGDRIAGEVRKASTRLAEIDALLAQPAFSREAAQARVAELEAAAASERAVATARVQLDNIERLAKLRDDDARALEELGDLLQALKAQLALARFSGDTQASGASGIVSEVWARVEGLGAALHVQGSETAT